MARLPVLLLAALLAPAPLLAQRDSTERAVMAVVTSLFDGMRAGDSAKVRAAFHPSVRLSTARLRDGKASVVIDTLDAFVRAVGTPHAEPWDERLRDTVVHVDGPLAVVWTGYAFYAGTRFSHCGIDAFQLARDGDAWRIVSLADTRQRTGCPEQAGGAR